MKQKSAFSLLELIFAIVIIGVIASVAIPKFMDTKADAQAATVKQDITTIVSSIRSYTMTNNVSALTNLSDILTLNSDIWTVDGTTATFKDIDTCIKISIDGSSLSVELTKNNTNTICSKIAALGVEESSSYTLY